MSFSFSAGGSKEAAKESLTSQLSAVATYGGDLSHAQLAAECLSKAIDGAPNGCEVSASAFGHHDYGCASPHGSFQLTFHADTVAPGSARSGQAKATGDDAGSEVANAAKGPEGSEAPPTEPGADDPADPDAGSETT